MKSVRYKEKFVIDRSVEVVFPLFSPQGEKLWVPGWDYEAVSDSESLHEDYIFKTKNHDHASNHAVWIVKKYDTENYFVEFYKVEPEDKTGIISVECRPENNCSTKVIVGYEYISLGEKGDEFIKDFTATSYKEFILEWQELLFKYFNS